MNPLCRFTLKNREVIGCKFMLLNFPLVTIEVAARGRVKNAVLVMTQKKCV
jgi:hypothetical protein